MKYTFNNLSKIPEKGTVVFFTYQDNKGVIQLDKQTKIINKITNGQIIKAIKILKFKAANGTTINIIAPNKTKLDAIIIVGLGEINKISEISLADAGANAFAEAKKISKNINFIIENKSIVSENILLGITLRAYKWNKYQTKENKKINIINRINIYSYNAKLDEVAWNSNKIHVAQSVLYARDLINEPSNKLNPETYALYLKELSNFGIIVEVFNEKILNKKGFNSLLNVGKGSIYESHVVVMQYNGGKKNDTPIALVGKGVTFDTGGISIKPSNNMDAMRGDMGGSAVVVATIRALAARKAKVNVVCVVGIVENMPSNNAMKPGDIVKSLSGQTIENLNTDAEGRLILADILWYTQDRFSPKVMLNAATLTGAIIIALGTYYAGFFTNDNSLVDPIKNASEQVGEPIWQMPLNNFYNKKINTPNADVKNISNDRWGGAIYAAVFLQRFVNNTPWVHIDLAGTVFDTDKTPINQGWSSGYGVRLLERFISKYEND